MVGAANSPRGASWQLWGTATGRWRCWQHRCQPGAGKRTSGGGRPRRSLPDGRGPDTPDRAAERARSWHRPSSFGWSRPGAIVKMNHAVAETAFVQEFEPQADIVGEGLFAASHHDGGDEQVVLVDQPGLDRLGGEVSSAHGEVTSR